MPDSSPPRCWIWRPERVADELAPLPVEVHELLAERLESIAQLEVLLLLLRSAPEAWDAERLSAELRIERAWAEQQLPKLLAEGFLERIGDTGPPAAALYRFAPASPDLAKAAASLAACYADRRVSVVAQLYSKPTRAVRGFADAFRLRRDDGDS